MSTSRIGKESDPTQRQREANPTVPTYHVVIVDDREEPVARLRSALKGAVEADAVGQRRWKFVLRHVGGTRLENIKDAVIQVLEELPNVLILSLDGMVNDNRAEYPLWDTLVPVVKPFHGIKLDALNLHSLAYDGPDGPVTEGRSGKFAYQEKGIRSEAIRRAKSVWDGAPKSVTPQFNELHTSTTGLGGMDFISWMMRIAEYKSSQ